MSLGRLGGLDGHVESMGPRSFCEQAQMGMLEVYQGCSLTEENKFNFQIICFY